MRKCMRVSAHTPFTNGHIELDHEAHFTEGFFPQGSGIFPSRISRHFLLAEGEKCGLSGSDYGGRAVYDTTSKNCAFVIVGSKRWAA